jgi:hypothetical protein
MPSNNDANGQASTPADEYVPYSFSADFAGAEPVVDEEKRYLAKRRAKLPDLLPGFVFALGANI